MPVALERRARAVGELVDGEALGRRNAAGEGDRWLMASSLASPASCDFMRSATSCATSVGVVPTSIPRASSASFFACAVPDEPEMIAPAWPIVLPGGAEKPAMYASTGFVTCSATYAAAFSSSSPPISPTSTISSVCGSASNFASDVDEGRADDGIAADADDRRVAEPELRQLVADLVRERPRARDEPDAALAEDLGRDDPDVRLARREDARAVRADHRHALRPRKYVYARSMSCAGTCSVMQITVRDARVDRLVDRVGGEARRDEDQRRVRAGLVDGVGDGVEDGDALDVLAALARRDAGDEVRAVRAVAQAVEAALAAGQALDDEARVVVDDDRH